jgi:hypothetical protein
MKRIVLLAASALKRMFNQSCCLGEYGRAYQRLGRSFGRNLLGAGKAKHRLSGIADNSEPDKLLVR